MQIQYTDNDIIALLEKVSIFNKDIGEFEIFGITENLDFAVNLSNGRILLKIEDLQDNERNALTPERLFVISNRFVSIYPQTNQQHNNNVFSQKEPVSKPTKKESKMGLIILSVIVAIVALTLGLMMIDGLFDGEITSNIRDTYNEKVKTVEEIEHEDPVRFLRASGDYKENFWGDKIKINCTIYNNATVATYKDVEVQVTYYTKTNTSIGSETHTIYEVFPPSSSKTIKLKINNHSNVNSIGWEVISADVY